MDDWLELAVGLSFLVVFGVLRLRNRGRVVDARTVRTLGTYGEFEVSLISSPGGRRYVGIGYEVVDDDTTREIQVLLTSASARRLAEMLEVAVAPGRTLLQARVAARRRLMTEETSSQPPR
jgi:hypothetical protein